jgi:hypothetical protein
MSQEPPQPQSYRGMMVKQEGDARSHLGEPLITIDKKHIDARTRTASVFAMATLVTMSAWVSKNRNYEHPSGFKADTKTLSGLMDCWEFNYKAKAISLDGKGREEYTKVASFIAVGSSDESGVLTQSLLNEGAKQMGGGKASKTK